MHYLSELNARAGVVYYGPEPQLGWCPDCGRPRYVAAQCGWCSMPAQRQAESIAATIDRATMPFGEWIREWAPKTRGLTPRTLRQWWADEGDAAQAEAVHMAVGLVRSVNPVRSEICDLPPPPRGCICELHCPCPTCCRCGSVAPSK